MNYSIDNHPPTPAEYRQLCESVGWGPVMNLGVANTALANTVAGVTVRDEDGTAIAMGRIVGDGVIYFYIQDVVVAPEYQAQGIGTVVLTELLGYVRDNAPEKCFVGLFSVPEAVEFYRKFTIEQRDLVGVFTVKELLETV